MAKIDRYVLRQIAAALISITITLTIVIWLAYSLRYLDYIVNRGLPFGTFVSLIVLMLPQLLALALPIALVCAVLFTYHRLIAESELVVLRASGLSDLRLALPALALSAMVMLLVALLNLQIAPTAARSFKDLQYAIRNDFLAVLAQPGVFRTIREGITFHIQGIDEDGHFRGILIHDTSAPPKRVTLMSERGNLIRSDSGPRIVLRSGNRQELDVESGKLSLLYFDQYTMDLGLPAGSGGRDWRDFDERDLGDLLSVTAEDVGARNVQKFRMEGHARIVSIAFAPALTSVALAVLLIGQLDRRSFARRVIAAGSLPLALLAISFAAKGLAGKVPAATPLYYLAILLPFAASLYFLLRSRRRTAAPTRPPSLATAAAPAP